MNELKFLQELLKIDSVNPPGNETRVSRLLAKRCQEIGLPFDIQALDQNRSNFIVEMKGRSEKKLLFCGHMDTVSPGALEWDYSPFSGELVGNKLYGRGASDMKSGLAAMFLALESIYLENIVPEYTLVFLATAGEEVDSCGARTYLEHHDLTNVEALIIGEPTNGKVVIGHKGALWIEITTHGKTAHGSMPDKGINAIEKMTKVIQLVEKLKLKWNFSDQTLGKSSLAVTTIHAGIQTNVIPDSCTISIDIRTVPPQSHQEIFLELQNQLNELTIDDPEFSFQLLKQLDRPSILTEKTSPIIQKALQLKRQTNEDCYSVSYYTDAAVLNPNSHIPTLLYGPGDESLAHQPNEWVDLSSYLQSIHFYRALMTER
jgi:succinyl-diaminopimelate desuccinylase